MQRTQLRAGRTGKVFIDAYKLDGTFMWRIDMGYNIRAGAHDTQLCAADFDGDGAAELIVRTADGTTDAQGNVIGDASKAILMKIHGLLLTAVKTFRDRSM